MRPASTVDTTGDSPHVTRVGVNLLWCMPGRVGGSEDYLVRQLLGIAAHGDEFRPTLFCRPTFAHAHPELASHFPMVAAPIDRGRRPGRVITENTWLAQLTRHSDVVHHGGGTVPPIGGGPILLTIHDLQYLTYPDYVSATKLRYLRIAVPRSIGRARVVAVPTEYVRSTVIEHFDVADDKVVVVPHGIEADLGASATPPGDLRHAYDLGRGPVVVYPAITHPHKGHRFLLEVMARHWPDPDLRLLLIGGHGSAEPAVGRAIVELGLSDRVVRTGRVSHKDRDGFIAMAEAVVFPSEYEGFGAPVAEAMALGTPVICSDQPALAEVVGAAGLVVPHEVEAWGGALGEVERRRDELIAAGRERARAFTVPRSGGALAAAYRRVLER